MSTSYKATETFVSRSRDNGLFDAVVRMLSEDSVETAPVECAVEFCGVYPIGWDLEDMAEFERMESDGEIVAMVYRRQNGSLVPNH